MCPSLCRRCGSNRQRRALQDVVVDARDFRTNFAELGDMPCRPQIGFLLSGWAS